MNVADEKTVVLALVIQGYLEAHEDYVASQFRKVPEGYEDIEEAYSFADLALLISCRVMGHSAA